MSLDGDIHLTVGQMAMRHAMSAVAAKKIITKAMMQPDADGNYSLREFRKHLPTRGPGNPSSAGHAGASAQVRKIEAETRLLEMKIAEREGQLVDIHEMTEAVGRMVVAAKNDLLAIGKRIAPECEGLSAGRIADKIDRAVRDALRHVAKYEPQQQAEERYGKPTNAAD